MLTGILLVIAFFAFLNFFVWILRSFEDSPQKLKKSTQSIRLAVAIPAHNEELLIAQTIKSILIAGVLPEDIFILCNGCTDRTEDKVSECGVHAVVVPRKGKAATLDYAVHELNLFREYTHVAFGDADTLFDKKYFQVTRRRLKNDQTIDIICGRPKSLPRNWLTAHRAIQYWKIHAIHKPAQAQLRSILVVPGCAGTYSTAVLQEIDWNTHTLMEDMSATIQAVLKGKRIVFEKDAIVYTQDPSTLRDYVNQLHRRWYPGVWMNMRKYGLLWKGPLSCLHWDCRFAVCEQIFCLFLLVPYRLACHFWHFTYNPQGALLGFGATVVAETVICAFICACAEKRYDVLKYLPFYPLLWVLDFSLFISTMPYLGRRSETDSWQHPERY